MSLYLKYRPATFDGLVGQDALKSILLHQIKTDQVFHNYLFFWGRGTGKTSTARLLAQAVNCRKLPDGSPDFSDPIAEQIRENKTIDVIEIDAASHTSVDNIREEIIDKSSYPPSQLRKKIYIIDEVHMLSKSAFNALLKIMEEPPCYPGTKESYIIFILATTELHKVPETIASRCQVFNFKQMTNEQVVEQLQMIADRECITTTQEWLSMIAKLAGGAMRDAIKYLEQVSMLGEVNAEHVSQFLGIASDDMISRIIQTIVDHNNSWLIWLLDSLALGGTDMTQLIKDCMSYCDEHFSKNPKTYAQLARQLKELYQSIKRYPNGLLARKVAFQSNIDLDTIGVNNWKPKEVKIIPQQKEASIVTVWTVAWDDENESLPTENIIPSIINPSELLESLIKSCDKTIIKSSLKNYTMIDRIHDGVIEAVIINEQFYSLMNKSDILNYLSDLVEQNGFGILQRKLSYMTKEDFAHRSLLA